MRENRAGKAVGFGCLHGQSVFCMEDHYGLLIRFSQCELLLCICRVCELIRMDSLAALPQSNYSDSGLSGQD